MSMKLIALCRPVAYNVKDAYSYPALRRNAQAAGDGRQIGSGRVSLVTPARYVPSPGSELTIDYGAKSNEQLLFLYGAPTDCCIAAGMQMPYPWYRVEAADCARV